MIPRLYILCGASGCGKTTLMKDMISEDKINCVQAPKYAERERRKEFDDITHVERIDLNEFDIAYALNDTRYGIRVDEIKNIISSGNNAVIILSDFRVVRRLKKLVPGSKAIYLSSAIDPERLRRIQLERKGFKPSQDQKNNLTMYFARTIAAARLDWWDRVSFCIEELNEYWRTYATDAQSTAVRAQRIRTFHIRYIEYLHLFDHVVLNYTEESPQEMVTQARNIINSGETDYSRRESRRKPPLFVVAAASLAGKGTLMEMLNYIGNDKITIPRKWAKRQPKANDRQDNTIALGVKPFPDECDLRWEFKTGIEYGISTAEISNNIRLGNAQIVISNMQTFDEFRRRWPEHTVFLYLHRLISLSELKEQQFRLHKGDPEQIEKRISLSREVHLDYLTHISEFEHVLLTQL